jgi:hypothetical protein
LRRFEHSHGGVAVAVLLGAVCLLAAPSLAAAAEYHDFLCRVPYGPSAGRSAPTDDVTYSINGAYVYAGNSCPVGGALYASMDGGLPQPFGSGGWDTFTAPAGLTIAGFTVWRYEADGPTQPYGAPASNLSYSPGPLSVQGLCAQSLGCSSRGAPDIPLDPSNAVSVGELSGVTQIQWSAICGGGSGGTCPESGEGTLSSQYDVYAADIDLVDDTPPTVSDVTGPLVDGGTTLSGQQTIAFDATDDQSGVYSGTLLVDGHAAVSQVLNTNGGACGSLNATGDGQRSFEHAQPCRRSLSTSLTLDTSELASGQHSLELIVEDAAGNQAIGYDGTISAAGPPPVGLEADAISPGKGAPNGEPCAGEALELAVNNRPVNAGRQPRATMFGKPVTVRGVLHCGTVPIRGARIDVGTIGGPATAAISTSVQTGLDGSFSYEVPTGPSRTLSFSYTAYSNDPGPSATATATIAIRPVIKLRIGPRRTSNGHAIHWNGRVADGPYPRQGVALDVEVREGRHWKIFAQTLADKRGRFHYSYRFHATTVATTYTFRVALPDTGARSYPYAPGASNTVKVRVAP